MSSAAMRNATLAVLLAAAPAQAETFHNKDGVVFEGTIRLVVSNAAVCNVLEEKYTAQEYEQLKANQGQPLDLWQVDFAVRNESGREIEYLRASRRVHSEHPPCTNWSGEGPGGGPVLPEPSLLISTGWGDYYQVLQRPYGMRPGQQERSARYLVVFHEHQPRFGEWDIDYTFAKEAGAGKEPAAGASRTPVSGGGDVHGAGGLGIAGEPVLAVDHEQHGGGGLRGVSAPVSERHLSGPGTESAGGLARVGEPRRVKGTATAAAGGARTAVWDQRRADLCGTGGRRGVLEGAGKPPRLPRVERPLLRGPDGDVDWRVLRRPGQRDGNPEGGLGRRLASAYGAAARGQDARPLGRALRVRDRRGRALCGRQAARPLGLALGERDRRGRNLGQRRGAVTAIPAGVPAGGQEPRRRFFLVEQAPGGFSTPGSPMIMSLIAGFYDRRRASSARAYEGRSAMNPLQQLPLCCPCGSPDLYRRRQVDQAACRASDYRRHVAQRQYPQR